MSRILSYSKYLSTFGSPNGSVSFDQPLKIDSQRSHQLRVIDFSISTQIPNVYNYGGGNNGLIRVTRDGGANYTSIQLVAGVYTVLQIQNAINETISTWYTSETDPAILVRSNTAVKKNYIVLDSTKLAAGGTQIGIDFSQSSVAELLGFITTQTFITDGTFTSSAIPHMDWVGNQLSVRLYGLGPLSIRDGSSSQELCRVNMATSTVTNLYVYPSYGNPPWINISPFNQISNFSVEIYGTRNDSSGNVRPIYLLEGEVNLTMELIEV